MTDSVDSRVSGSNTERWGTWRGLEEAEVIEGLTPWQSHGKELADDAWPEVRERLAGGEWLAEDAGGSGLVCGTLIGVGVLAGQLCPRGAGQGTGHVGFGRCVAHGGAKRVGRAEGGWLMALSFVGERDITPWAAMLEQVRLLAGQVAYCRQRIAALEVIAEAEGREQGACLLEGEGHQWVGMLEARGDRLAKVSKSAIDAGIAERLVRQVELEAGLMLRALNLALDKVPLGEVERETVLEIMSTELVRLEGEQNANFGRVLPAGS
jgi:hypothetical protein